MIWHRCVSFILLRRIPDHINMICVHGNRFPNGWSRRRFWNNLNPVSSFPMTNKELLTMAFSPLPIGLGYLSKPSLVSKQPLICAYWPSCTWSYPNSSNDVAALGISFPRHTSLSPWCGVPMKNMPYVETWIDFKSFWAWQDLIKACLWFINIWYSFHHSWEKTYISKNHPSQFVSNENNRAFLGLSYLLSNNN